MSNVSLSIGGRTFSVACADGEEDHVAGLGRMIHAKVAEMGDGGSANESRMLLFAALLLADEVSDLREGGQGAAGPATGSAPDPARAARLDDIVRRLENLADRLED